MSNSPVSPQENAAGWWDNLVGGTFLDRDKDGDVDLVDVKLLAGDLLGWLFGFIKSVASKTPKTLLEALKHGMLAANEAARSGSLGSESKWNYAMDEALQYLADKGLNIVIDKATESVSDAIARAFNLEGGFAVDTLLQLLVDDYKRKGVID